MYRLYIYIYNLNDQLSELDPMRSTLQIVDLWRSPGGQHINDAQERSSQYSTMQRRPLDTGCVLLKTSKKIKKVTGKASQ